ncbi:MAG: DUF1292 domain-containing protein [Youngiibacter sp.]|nr:DUF1292 domain-containing protein [Youngiibacter sp.]
MKFKDEDGNVVELEAVARVYVEEQEYLVLAPLDDNSDDEFVFRVDKDSEGKEELNAVEDDEEFQKVKKEYKNLLYGEVE